MKKILNMFFGKSNKNESHFTNNNINQDDEIRVADAIDSSDADFIKRVLNCDNVNYQFKSMGTPLLYAANYGNFEMVKLLISKGANPNIKFKEMTPLSRAVEKGFKNIVKFLLANGADPNIREYRGHLPLHAVIAARDHLYTVADKIELISDFCLAKADMNAKDMGGAAIHYAYSYDFNITLRLIECGTNINIQADEYRDSPFPAGFTILHLYMSFRKYANALELIKLGANIFIKDNGNQSPYGIICSIVDDSEDFNKLKLLVQEIQGADQDKEIHVMTCNMYSGWYNYYNSLLRKSGVIVTELSFIFTDLLLENTGAGSVDFDDISDERLLHWRHILSEKSGNMKIMLFVGDLFFHREKSSKSDINNYRHCELFINFLISEINRDRVLLLVQPESIKYISSPPVSNLNFYFLDADNPDKTWQKILQFVNIDYTDNTLHELSVKEKKYDIFLSYVSQDAFLVRFIAEQLMAKGLSVWFAEYSVESFELNFQEIINQGIAQSKKIICFSNKSYNQSEYCQIEAYISRNIISPENILEIELVEKDSSVAIDSIIGSKHKRFSTSSSNVRYIWGVIAGFIGEVCCEVIPSYEVEMMSYVFTYKELRFFLKIPNNWVVKENNSYKKTDIGFDKNVCDFGDGDLCCRLTVGESAHPAKVHQISDERAFFRRVNAVFLEYRASMTDQGYLDILATHLVFTNDDITFEKKAHPAFTYLYRSKKNVKYQSFSNLFDQPIILRNTYDRLYSITLETKKYGYLEFCFYFEVIHDDLTRFLEKAYLMDRIVSSLIIED